MQKRTCKSKQINVVISNLDDVTLEAQIGIKGVSCDAINLNIDQKSSSKSWYGHDHSYLLN